MHVLKGHVVAEDVIDEIILFHVRCASDPDIVHGELIDHAELPRDGDWLLHSLSSGRVVRHEDIVEVVRQGDRHGCARARIVPCD